jgi:hypothetical protein
MIQQITSLFSYLKSLRGEMKKSRLKIWLRAFLFLQFSAIFCFYFFRDIAHGYFSWERVALLFTLFIPVGFLMSLIVPMKADLELRAVTLSLDHIYLFLIWLLVIAKLIIGRVPPFTPEADFIMRHYGYHVRAAGWNWVAGTATQTPTWLYFEVINIMVTL